MGDAAYLIPNKGAMVRDPVTKELLPAKGMAKTLLGAEGRYWRRRIKGGSVIKGKPPVVQKTATATHKGKPERGGD